MASGFYVPGASFLHLLHPVTRIVLLLLSFGAALALRHPLHLLALWLPFLAVGARAGAMKSLRTLYRLMILIGLASFLIWSLAYEGDTIAFSAGPIEVTLEGMVYGAGMGLRLDLMILCGLIFLAATPVEEFSYGLTRMGVPFSVSFAMSLSFRLAPLFTDTVRTITEAQRARGLDTGAGGPVAKMKSYVPLLAPVFASALRRTDQLSAALESKGFGLGVPRTSMKRYEAGWRDAAALVIMAALLALAAVLRISGPAFLFPGPGP